MKEQPVDLALLEIHCWWSQTPWRPFYLHWDDRLNWPDPWQLLADNIYCDLARALGMLYTVLMLDRQDCSDAVLAQTEQGNLVLVQQGKYIMNWIPDKIVNIASQEPKIKTVLEPDVLELLTG
jgi:hypothetical protein